MEREQTHVKHKHLGKFSRLLLRLKLWRRKYLFFYTTTPGGPHYLSVLRFNLHGLAERRVFVVTGEELDSTPYVDGMSTKKLFFGSTKTSPTR
ncbi:MAG: hypothetical protein RRY65_07825 [Pseudoflavonifractor sp.]